MNFNLALCKVYLFTSLLVLTAAAPVMAVDAPKQEAMQETKNYQSSFDDYKPLSKDDLSDWKSINVPANGGGGHAGHSIAGMQDEMTPEQMANMPSDSKKMPAMEDMDHSNMKGMDHSQMKPDQTMTPMAGMDHSKMAPMNDGNVKSKVDNKPTISKEMPAMEGMDHSNMEGMKKTASDDINAAPDRKSAIKPVKKEDMQEMNHDEMTGHDHGGSDMKAMDHSNMSESNMIKSQPNDLQPRQESTLQDKAEQQKVGQDESKAHEHTSTKGSEHAGMSMPANLTADQATATQATPWQIIPNYHPIIVHFPIALTIVAFIMNLAAYVRRSHLVSLQLAAAGHFTLWLAAISAVAAVLFGWLAFNSVNHDDAGHVAMLLHRSWAISTALGLILLASWDAWKYRVNELISVPMLFLLFLLSQAIAVTGWLGGEVVYRHGIGVLSLPSSNLSEHGQHFEHGGKDATEHAHGMTEDKAGEKTDEPAKHPTDEKGESHEH